MNGFNDEKNRFFKKNYVDLVPGPEKKRLAEKSLVAIESSLRETPYKDLLDLYLTIEGVKLAYENTDELVRRLDKVHQLKLRMMATAALERLENNSSSEVIKEAHLSILKAREYGVDLDDLQVRLNPYLVKNRAVDPESLRLVVQAAVNDLDREIMMGDPEKALSQKDSMIFRARLQGVNVGDIEAELNEKRPEALMMAIDVQLNALEFSRANGLYVEIPPIENVRYLIREARSHGEFTRNFENRFFQLLTKPKV